MADTNAKSKLKTDPRRSLLVGPHAGSLPKATKDTSVVIVTFNSATFIGPCLASVLPTLGNKDEVVIVDNASTDGTLAAVGEVKDKRMSIVTNSTNRGYAPAANQGILASKGHTIVLLNPDTEVSGNWLEAMSHQLKDGVGAVGPVCDAVTGMQFAGRYFHGRATRNWEESAATFSERFPRIALPTRLLVGVCLMVPRLVFNEAGLFDEDMLLGADDLDFSWRLRGLGYRLCIAMDAFVHHVWHASFATVPNRQTAALIETSDHALVKKLKTYYGANVPSSTELWGFPIFDQALATVRAS